MLITFFLSCQNPLLFCSLWTDRSSCLEVFCKNGVLRKIHRATSLPESLLTLLKKRPWHKCFSVNFEILLRTNFYKEHLWSLLLNKFLFDFWNFRNTFKNRPPVRSKRSQVLYKIGILKKYAKFPWKQQCWSHFLRKSAEIKRLQYRFFPENIAKH